MVQGLSMSIAWWIALTARDMDPDPDPFGNWIFAAGGDMAASRNVGVPVERVRSCSSSEPPVPRRCCDGGARSGLSRCAARGTENSKAVIAAVIGNNLLTGGYGSAIGAMFGARGPRAERLSAGHLPRPPRCR